MIHSVWICHILPLYPSADVCLAALRAVRTMLLGTSVCRFLCEAGVALGAQAVWRFRQGVLVITSWRSLDHDPPSGCGAAESSV